MRATDSGPAPINVMKRLRRFISEPIVRPFLFLEHQPQTELRLPRIAQSALHRAVEIKQQAGGFRMLRIRAIRQVERIDNRLQPNPLRELEGLRRAEVEREERI